MPVDRAELICIARTWLGVPFAHQGRTRAGVDCGGLLLAIGAEAGLDLVPSQTYSMSPDPDLIRDTLAVNCRQIAATAAQPGDVLWLAFAGEPRHVGLLTDIGLLHAWKKPGRVVEHAIDATWQRRIRSAWTLREVTP